MERETSCLPPTLLDFNREGNLLGLLRGSHFDFVCVWRGEIEGVSL